MSNRKAMLVNKRTYGYYYADSGTFECTHGAWEGHVTFIDDNTCYISVVNGVCTYEWISKIPESYIF